MPLRLHDFLSSPTCDLPRDRNPKISLSKQLDKMYSTFLSALKSTDPSDRICMAALKERGLIKKAGAKISSAVNSYLNGSPFQAATTLREGLELLQPHLEKLTADRQQLSNLFRVREVDTLVNSQRKDIFHVPFELRHRVTTQRYSISGWPSLYLGASLMVCWEEVGRPAFHKLAVASFDAEKSMTVLDFGYRPSVIAKLHEPVSGDISFFTPEYMVTLLSG